MWAARPTVEAFDRHSCTDMDSARLLSAFGHEAPTSLVLRADKVIEEQLISPFGTTRIYQYARYCVGYPSHLGKSLRFEVLAA